MKVKTIVGLMACAVLVPAFADIDNNKATTNDWFSARVSGESVYVTGAAWNTTPAVEGSTTKVMVIDADVTSPATLTPTEAKATEATKRSDGLVTITSRAYLAPSATNDLPNATALESAQGSAQVGFAVAVNGESVTNYYGYVRTGENTGNWFALTGATPPVGEGNTTFTIVLDYRSTDKKVSFVVDSTTLAAGNSTAFTFLPVNAKLSNVAAIGSGTITSINAKFEEAVAVGKDGKAYGTIAEAYNTTGSGTVAVWDPENGDAYADQTTANGLGKAVCMALNIAPDAKIALEPAVQNVENTVVLKTAVDPVDDVTVTFAVKPLNGSASGEYSANAIQVPLEAGSYQVVPTVAPKATPAP